MLVLDEVVPFQAAVADATVATVTDCGLLNTGISIFLRYYKIKRFYFVTKLKFLHNFAS